MSYDEKALSEKVVGKLFLIPPQDVDCEFCGNSQKVPIPVQVTAVNNGLISGPGGSMIYVCESCGGPAEVTWDDANVQVTQFIKK
jgi:hypothetical protein